MLIKLSAEKLEDLLLEKYFSSLTDDEWYIDVLLMASE